ncbi:hypothetical protein [Nocardia sp. XZ_19_369]|uniref:hypothetical protein n=1 Tax=Nocardia sp. XZ_19_369 TaxID=2769487 RepID=UPI00189090BC|nr:hypothetical protein [Nocardia sp. XZ_19_369]
MTGSPLAMTSSEPTRSFILTDGQLVFIQYVIERGFLEFLEYARNSKSPPGDLERVQVDGFLDLCEIFGVEVPNHWAGEARGGR